jgi:hypothetical protein
MFINGVERHFDIVVIALLGIHIFNVQDDIGRTLGEDAFKSFDQAVGPDVAIRIGIEVKNILPSRIVRPGPAPGGQENDPAKYRYANEANANFIPHATTPCANDVAPGAHALQRVCHADR